MENKSIKLIKKIWKSVEESKGEKIPTDIQKNFSTLMKEFNGNDTADIKIYNDFRYNFVNAIDKWLDIAYMNFDFKAVNDLEDGKEYYSVPHFHFLDILRKGCPEIFKVQPDMTDAIYSDIPGSVKDNFVGSKIEECVTYAPTYFRKRILKVD